MTDRYTRDELLDHAQDFDDLAPNRGENERASASAALSAHRPGTHNPTGPVRHNFKASPNPRNDGCAACGRSKSNAVHHQHPELRKAAVIAALDMACKHTREDEGDMALIQVGVAARLLRGDDT